MEKINFNVSSKTARLIGRENISDSNGAIIELVKNAYDADASLVYIDFNIIFEAVPNEIDFQNIKKIFSKDEISFLLNFYNQDNGNLVKKDNLTANQENKLEKMFFEKNQIIILDNGVGMNEEIIKTVWMNIGTDDKENNSVSAKGRVKTGAKGIGRFALEKLSQNTIVYSKKNNNKTVFWKLDWNQFENFKLLDDIKADIEVIDKEMQDVIKNYIDSSVLGEKIKEFKNGTFIILKGTRDVWNEKIFKRINNNLMSINPFGNVDKFDVIVNNRVKHSFDYRSEDTFLSDDNYDYFIKAIFNGENEVEISLKRNEVDLKSKIQTLENGDKAKIDEFWKREAFKNYPYKKENYNQTITNIYKVSDLLKVDNIENIKKIGKFSIELYFLKSGRSEYSFIKDFKVNERRKLLSKFSGIKIYRDDFKVRPYGEEDGPMYDWLSLGSRSQKNPASVSHPNSSWHVNTYQLIGNVKISRKNNPELKDMANREALALNDTYFLFVELIQEIISKFEYDRQYVYREYALWVKSLLKEKSKNEDIKQSIKNEKENKEKSEESFTEEEYREALYEETVDKEYSDKTLKILMNFSVAGVTANTFAHEMESVSNNLDARNSQLRMCIDNILEGNKFEENDFYDPYKVIKEGEAIDILLSKWLKIIMDSVSKSSSKVQRISLMKFFEEIYDDWSGLLNEKYIYPEIECDNDVYVELEKTDLYLIFNNLILNSSYYLERKINGNKRIIRIKIVEKQNNVYITFENNGPSLDEKYLSTPDIIFNAGETSKIEGTGLGLWICKEAVIRNYGEIHTIPIESGFKIEIKLPKVR